MSVESSISADNPVRVMIVDDSAVVRGFLTRFIETDSEIKVVSSSFNGQQAVNSLKKIDVDVIVLDIEMPVMDGLTALPLLLEEDPCVQVIVASTLTEKNAEITFKAMKLGATECLAKPTTKELSGSDNFRLNLIQKVKSLGVVARKKRESAGVGYNKGMGRAEIVVKDRTIPEKIKPKAIEFRDKALGFRPEIIAIGSSTGGPQALSKLFADIAELSVKQTIFITQHMPPTFTTILATNIAKTTGMPCKEAEDGEVVQRGHIYLAKGGLHMKVERKGVDIIIRLTEDAPENYCRPAVDPMMRSLMDVYGSNKILAVILTGMGADGMKSCTTLADTGGVVLAQDEATSVVWGMPGAVANAGVCTNVLPLGLLAKEIKSYAG